MISLCSALVVHCDPLPVAHAQYLTARDPDGVEHPAINYPDLTGEVRAGDTVQLNVTARKLKLGTGGVDFVVANLTRPDMEREGPGHIVKGRYLPCQHAVLTLEEQPEHAWVWDGGLEGFPVLVGQLHSQVAPTAAGLRIAGKTRIVYIMTDGAALPLPFSKVAVQARRVGLLTSIVTCGQAFGGDHETVTLHSALFAAKNLLRADAAIVCQGPGTAGTGTRYGFSGIEQAQNLDTACRLGGTTYAIVRMSSADPRARHRGVSHHTRTTLSLTQSKCIVPIPLGTGRDGLPERHDIREIEGAFAAYELLASIGIDPRSMGRGWSDDPDFFSAAAAAGLAVR